MADALRESMHLLRKPAPGPVWKAKLPKGVVLAESYETQKGKKATWRPKPT